MTVPGESDPRRGGRDASSYAARLHVEKSIYHDCLDVHELPAIFHYWSNRYVRPKLEALGFSTPDEMFRKYAAERCRGSGRKRLVSVGSGNCELEIALALHLRAMGCGEFVIDCLELNPAMLERGRNAAAGAGAGDHLNFVQMDLNEWTASEEYDVAIANQTLHHVLNLENLFDQIGRSLKPGGALITADMIGRNGHLRWPEALDIVQEFWRKLPPSYRFNRRFGRYEESFEDWDCSVGNFEGIRAQDILPLLLGRFHFELFVAYANVIDPFVDRTYGMNFDAAAAWDREFIDQVNGRDEKEIAAGRIKPTHMLAVLGKDPGVPTVYRESLTPEFCLRDPSRVVVSTGVPGGYEWAAWPHNPQREVEIVCRLEERLKETNALVEERTAWAYRLDQEIDRAWRRIQELDKELERHAGWAKGLDREIDRARLRIKELEGEVIERTDWAMRLEREWQERTDWALSLEQELKECSERVLLLQRELKERTSWARMLNRQVEQARERLALGRRGRKLLGPVFRMARRVWRR